MSQWEPVAPGPGDDRPATAGRDRGRNARLIVTGIAVVLLVWFALVNFQTVRIRFWVVSDHAPLILVIVISGVLGAGVSGLWSRVRRRRAGGRS